jgi:hypothetical protein
MENGYTKENEPGLLTVPQQTGATASSAANTLRLYVQAGDRFRTIVNCQHNSPNCNVVFRLDYQERRAGQNPGKLA